jgi:LPXTG-motif cell wall-anchored protein
VEVTDDGNGQLVAGDPVVTLADSTEAAAGIVFNNAYNPNIPQTGDDTNLTLWLGLMVLCVLAAAAMLIFEKKSAKA